jgi:hypothetical protein
MASVSQAARPGAKTGVAFGRAPGATSSSSNASGSAWLKIMCARVAASIQLVRGPDLAPMMFLLARPQATVRTTGGRDAPPRDTGSVRTPTLPPAYAHRKRPKSTPEVIGDTSRMCRAADGAPGWWWMLGAASICGTTFGLEGDRPVTRTARDRSRSRKRLVVLTAAVSPRRKAPVGPRDHTRNVSLITVRRIWDFWPSYPFVEGLY